MVIRWVAKLVFVSVCTHYILTVGEALMPPVGKYVFAAMPRKTAAFYRREAKMPPLQ